MATAKMTTTGKTISKTTLGLRFMQMAEARKAAAAAAGTTARTVGGEDEVKRVEDEGDGHWEVSREVREAWGLVSGESSSGVPSSYTPTTAVQHEPSYLPFLFPSEDGAGTTRPPRGRRTWNKHGQEVGLEEKTLIPEWAVDATAEDSAAAAADWLPLNVSKPHPRAKPKPGSAASEKHRRKDDGGGVVATQGAVPKKTAREAIFDLSGVGMDLGRGLGNKLETSAGASSLGLGFIKPAGVDDPLSPGQRAAAGGDEVKREREEEEEGGKRKKKVKGEDGEGERSVKKKKRKKEKVV